MSANSRQYRSKAAVSARQATECESSAEAELFRRAESAWSTLAENEERLECKQPQNGAMLTTNHSCFDNATSQELPRQKSPWR
jgi:hypothetical protein